MPEGGQKSKSLSNLEYYAVSGDLKCYARADSSEQLGSRERSWDADSAHVAALRLQNTAEGHCRLVGLGEGANLLQMYLHPIKLLNKFG